ncbi:sugar transferase [uncultured Litoreibacter sp.]|uniref:sugar transferase n=1 Tax=uncultured Litoreibacter sp. TaxID=1392394 RepID=UPI00345ABEA6
MERAAMTAPIRNFNVDERVHTDLRPRPSDQIYSAHFKRAVDVTLVLSTAIVTVPFILLAALLISLDGASPFYVQRRIGRGGRQFRMWKLRTMRVGAEALLSEQLSRSPTCAREWQLSQKLRTDPRVTIVGRLLRKTSLDELPQLWNVLRGDMSLVGPRPMMVEQMSRYQGTDYFTLRPGMTGLWQVSARNSSTFEARAQFDATYAAKQSFLFDLFLMLRTVGVVLRGTGY